MMCLPGSHLLNIGASIVKTFHHHRDHRSIKGGTLDYNLMSYESCLGFVATSTVRLMRELGISRQ